MNNTAKLLLVIVCLLATVIGVQRCENTKLEEKWKASEANVKAYDSQLGYEREKNTAFQLTINQLEYFQDSVLKALDETRKELKIKDKNLKALQAVQSSFKKKDTIKILQVDTLFREPSLCIDTVMGDRWYTLQLGLKYPSTIAVSPSFTSEKHIIVSSKKETVDPPKKFFLFRWFQKKHVVLDVDVVEKNPYVEGESSKYIEILK